jgi:hypothetical protein
MEKETYYLLALVIWSIPWKGFALWKSARRGEKIWFMVLLIINTAGILEILYLFFLSNSPRVHPKKERILEINPY